MEKRKPAVKWPVPTVLTELVARSERLEIEPAEVGRLLGRRSSKKPNAERQSFYDIKDGKKRIWLHDAEQWAKRLGGRLGLRYDDPWAQLDAAISALPDQHPSYRQLKRHLRAIVRDEEDDGAQSRPKGRAASS